MAGKKYLGLVISRERQERNWNQEDLCKGICTVSYLSKIETGKAEPSDEILESLFERLGLKIDEEAVRKGEKLAQQAYSLLFSGMDEKVRELLKDIDLGEFRTAVSGLDLYMLKKIVNPTVTDLPLPPEGLADCMDSRQLALFRILQDKQEEALLYYPNAYTYFQAGLANYRSGNFTAAVDRFQAAYDLAARNGLARIMLNAMMSIGNAYFNQLDSLNMYRHYEIAVNLARAIGDDAALAHINYYMASTSVNLGEYEKAYAYFSELGTPNKLQLHKLAVCCEKLGKKEEGLAALDKADTMSAQTAPESLVNLICDVVRYRLEHPDYLEHEEYGELLQKCYSACLKERPRGFDVFHLPWMIEWFKGTRQYKKACELLSNFPQLSFISA